MRRKRILKKFKHLISKRLILVILIIGILSIIAFTFLRSGKKIIIVDHGKEISINLNFINITSKGVIDTVGDVIKFLNIPLSSKQAKEINLCKKIDELSDKEKIVINPDIYQYGVASWYGPGFQGKITANGERYNIFNFTAAHKTLPFGSMVRVFNMHNDRSVVVRINDRGPFVVGRIIDLSWRAKQKLDVNDITSVYLEILDPDALNKPCN